MEPPVVRMITPSGRFVPSSSICMSMTVWHKDTWNPLWGIRSILLGLQSFFYSEEDGLGGIRESKATREILASKSDEYNLSIDIFKKLFID